CETPGRSEASRPRATSAAAVEPASCNGSSIQREGMNPRKLRASGIASTRNAREENRTTRSGSWPNATTKVARYRDSGNTHSSGTDAMSLDRYRVTPSIDADGRNASKTHRDERRTPIGRADGSYYLSAGGQMSRT